MFQVRCGKSISSKPASALAKLVALLGRILNALCNLGVVVRWFGVNEEFRAVVSVKGGTKLGVEMVRSLDAVVKAQGAQIGVLLTLEKPTKPMLDWAAQAGMCEVPGFAPVNRLQIVTVEQALELRERAVEMPARRNDTFKQAPKEEKVQGKLDL